MELCNLKEILLKIELELLKLSPNSPIYFHQQEKQKRNMAFKGLKNETLWIQPRKNGFAIGLSGISLVSRMTLFMKKTFSSEPSGHWQLNKNKEKKDLPFWCSDDISKLKSSIFYYADIDNCALLTDFPDEITSTDNFFEGAVREVKVNAYERNPKARNECIKYFGAHCQVCSFDFLKAYGSIGKEYIQVHHIVPLSEIGVEYKVNPRADLVPVCANCHVMLHRKKEMISINDLKSLFQNNLYHEAFNHND
ncbi:HNH endonuclease [Aliivibrio fischeri]|uniref:HNH endonuclease n=1 Tax=Aliivibrio fischeri TaxID=668 RepID=UPI00084C28A4|nr:HNH endonuclease [Aliivibrio fischeri]OED54404.1 hypothetical protein BEI47_17140 [Aliivibrio fischeri]